MATDTPDRGSADLLDPLGPGSVHQGLRILVAALAGLLVLSALVVGTVAVIAELKGTWHWSIHLESTISIVGAFVKGLLVLFVPATLALAVTRQVVGDG